MAVLMGATAAGAIGVAQAQSAPAPAADGASAQGDIVVTAQKRAQRSIDVPASITAIGGATLEAKQVTQLTDLVGTVPGLSISNYGGPGMNTIQLRGLAGSYLDDFAGPLVATYIDDLPVGSSTAAGRGNLFTLDLQPYDMEAVEILRGPQGTLYGANSMGGLIKYSLKKPDVDHFEGRVGADFRQTMGGAMGYAPRAAVNIPLIKDKLALRASGFYTKTPGYIDNVGTGIKDANASKSYGGRVALLWNATDHLKLHGGAVLQNSQADDVTSVLLQTGTTTPVYGPQITYSRFPGYITQKTRDYTAGADLDLGFATLTTSAGWVEMNNFLVQDTTTAAAPASTGLADGRTSYNLYSKLRKFTEETRLTSSEHARLQYTLGVYYTAEHAGEDTSSNGFTAQNVPIANLNIRKSTSTYKYSEIAAFGNATYKFSDKFDLSAGGRVTRYRQYGYVNSTGNQGVGTVPADTGKTTVGIWSVNARYHFDRDLMLYGRFATGYRPGAFNNPSTVCSFPNSSSPDRTKNYEGGVKGALFGRKLNVEATVYHIDWTDMQLNVTQVQNGNSCIFVTNGGRATSDGVELSSGLQATHDFRLGGTLTYQDAKLKTDLPLSGGKAGDRLPLSSPWQWSATADYKRDLGDDSKLLIGASYTYKGPYVNRFQSSGSPYPFKAQNVADAYIGGERGPVSVRLTMKNVFNNRSYVGLQYVREPLVGMRAIPVTPRTVAISVDYKF